MCLKPDINNVKSPLLNVITGPVKGAFGDYVWNIFLLVEILWENVFIHPPGKYSLILYYVPGIETVLGIH